MEQEQEASNLARANEGNTHGDLWRHIHSLHKQGREFKDAIDVLHQNDVALQQQVEEIQRDIIPDVHLVKKRTGRIQWQAAIIILLICMVGFFLLFKLGWL